MSKNDYVIRAINDLNQINGMPEDGFFLNVEDRTYRLEAIRQIFCGLERENQDKVLRYAMESLLSQIPISSDKFNLIKAVVA